MAVHTLPWQSQGPPQSPAVTGREMHLGSEGGSSSCIARLHLHSHSHLQRRVRRSRWQKLCSRELVTARNQVCRRRRGQFVVGARLFDPEDFDPSKLTVSFEDESISVDVLHPGQLLPRTYTLTHSDVTGELQLSIGPCYNQTQLDGWYTRLMRDEIVADWSSMNGRFSLHIHCHISGGHHLLAPAALRYRIFQREMPLVLQAIRFGDGALFVRHPELDASTVWVHFHSDHDQTFDRADCWGPLCYAVVADRLKAVGAEPLLLPAPAATRSAETSQNEAAQHGRSSAPVHIVDDGTLGHLTRYLRLAAVSSEKPATILFAAMVGFSTFIMFHVLPII